MFTTAMLVASAFLLALTWIELEIDWSGFKQVGESSLGRNSVNWLGGIALVLAVAICSLVS